MYSIRAIKARTIFDSRGNPTVECEVKTAFGVFKSAVPSGASTGTREAKELRDGGKEFNGQGVTRAVRNINEIIAPKLIGKDCREQKLIDGILLELDPTPQKEKLGANALLAVSLATARAGAISKKKEVWQYMSELTFKEAVLPIPALNIINGGKHAGNEIAFQEYQILPINFKHFDEAFSAGVEVFHSLKKNLQNKYGKCAINVGDEGGFAPQMKKVEEPLDEITKAIDACGYAGSIYIGLDVAASSFAFKDGVGKTLYNIEGHKLSGLTLANEYEELLKYYPIASIEDPFDEDDYYSWENFYSTFGKRVQILADDLTVTQKNYIVEAIQKKRANALLLKVNQVGTLTEALESAKIAMDANWGVQVSHRSGETNDYFIADLSVGLGCGQIKSGAPCRGERLAKYNRILKIEEENKLKFAGKKAFPLLK
ncbi:MAG TPA: phosphopyruvate hydratase [archaeon]|nr:phosphopyruvate hydratase [archaeon]